MSEFKTDLAYNVFKFKYANYPEQTWAEKAKDIVQDICSSFMSESDQYRLEEYIRDKKFIPGGRYIYYAGKPAKFYNNCLLLKGEEDTREEWAALAQRSTAALMSGAGIGIDYSVFRPEGAYLGRTGGEASGPIPLMEAINEIGRNVKQGGSRRSAIYASLNWQHDDADSFLAAKNWHEMGVGNTGYSVWDIKQQDFNYPGPLDMTNISLNYDDSFLAQEKLPETFIQNCRQALSTAEPGFSFNFGEKQNETLRNA